MRLWNEEGTATVELAILAPILGMLLGMMIFVGDLGVARIRQREVARLAAWEVSGHALSDEMESRHAERWEAARTAALETVNRVFGGEEGVSRGLLAGGELTEVRLAPVAMAEGGKMQRPSLPSGTGSLLEPLGSLLQKGSGLQLPLLRSFGLHVDRVGVVVEAGIRVVGSGLLPDLPEALVPEPARLELQIDTWAADDGSDVPLPGTDTALGRQVGRIAHFGLGEKLQSSKAGEALSWIPIPLRAPVVSMAYGPPDRDQSPVECGGDDPLARTGRWENGPQVGTVRDRMSPVRCFDTLPIDANGFGKGGGRISDPTWRMLQRRGPWEMGCDRPGVSFPSGCGKGGGPWASVSSR